jgi:hypothetical protein
MTGVAPWWVTIVVAVITGAAALSGSALVTWRQNSRANREEWFRRVQWAHELTQSDRDEVQGAGFRLLEHLADSPLAKQEDQELLLQLVQKPELAALAQVDDVDVDDIDYVRDTGTDPAEETP